MRKKTDARVDTVPVPAQYKQKIRKSRIAP